MLEINLSIVSKFIFVSVCYSGSRFDRQRKAVRNTRGTVQNVSPRRAIESGRFSVREQTGR